jgi:hypothetical protein
MPFTNFKRLFTILTKNILLGVRNKFSDIVFYLLTI